MGLKATYVSFEIFSIYGLLRKGKKVQTLSDNLNSTECICLSPSRLFHLGITHFATDGDILFFFLCCHGWQDVVPFLLLSTSPL